MTGVAAWLAISGVLLARAVQAGQATVPWAELLTVVVTSRRFLARRAGGATLSRRFTTWSSVEEAAFAEGRGPDRCRSAVLVVRRRRTEPACNPRRVVRP